VSAAGPAPGQPRAWAEVAYGLGLAAAGVALGVLTTEIKVAPIYAKIGPTVFPWMAAGGLVLVGFTLAWFGWRQTAQPAPRDNLGLIVLGAGLLQQILLVGWAGFVPTAALLFLATAAAFGRRRPLVDLAIGLVLALAVYLLFTRLLGLSLPAGWLAGIL
jgi:putative tricarboxylic transport membrane protein